MHEERFDEAKPIFEECLRKYQSWGNEDDVPFEDAKYYQLYAFIQMANGQQTEALATSRKGVEAVGKAASANLPIYQSARFFLANLMFHAGILEECLEVKRRRSSREKEVVWRI